ncbi:hypothetical protein [Pseudohoeflea suaedae]|uniref:hypothetical protein n=1 Tax=Pseudohoeflea suaedae TaxID=877384 RepID=UPI0010586F7B|nr:hypothetical protein [Pseudohoeflea suaedae]
MGAVFLRALLILLVACCAHEISRNGIGEIAGNPSIRAAKHLELGLPSDRLVLANVSTRKNPDPSSGASATGALLAPCLPFLAIADCIPPFPEADLPASASRPTWHARAPPLALSRLHFQTATDTRPAA